MTLNGELCVLLGGITIREDCFKIDFATWKSPNLNKSISFYISLKFDCSFLFILKFHILILCIDNMPIGLKCQESYNTGDYIKAIVDRQKAESISNVLYPDDRSYQVKCVC